jgi:hypothetical protein
MTKDLEIVVDEPLQVLALGLQGACEPVPGLGVVRWRIRVVAVVVLVGFCVGGSGACVGACAGV